MSWLAQLVRIELIQDPEVRIEAINHVFSMENSHVQFSYTVLLTTAAAFVATFIGTFVTFAQQRADLFHMTVAFFSSLVSIAMFFAIYQGSLRELKNINTNYMTAIVDLIIQRQGVTLP